MAALVVGGMAGAALSSDDDDSDRLRVNGSEVAQNVWEANPQPSEAPRCTPRTADGIGAWRCSIRYAGRVKGFDPQVPDGVPAPPTADSGPSVRTATLTVNDSGEIRGELDGEPFRACCIRVR